MPSAAPSLSTITDHIDSYISTFEAETNSTLSDLQTAKHDRLDLQRHLDELVRFIADLKEIRRKVVVNSLEAHASVNEQIGRYEWSKFRDPLAHISGLLSQFNHG